MKWKHAWIAALALPALCSPAVYSQQTSTPEQAPEQSVNPSAPGAAAAAAGSQDVLAGPVASEDDLRRVMVGKQFFIRGLWLDDDLHFNMYGDLVSTSPKGSFTLCLVQIDHVSVSKKRVELEGERYGMHFADAANWADQSTSFDTIRVTPKKRHLTITIDRQQVVATKKKDQARPGAAAAHAAAGPATGAAAPPAAQSAPDASANQPAGTTTSPGNAAAELRYAINRILAPVLDGKMIAQMPDYWQYFYKAQMDHHGMEPTDPNIVHPGPGVDGPKLVRNLVAPSNDFAQHAQVAGVASYKVILDNGGRPIGVAVYRPIGFGLDENAVDAIRKSVFIGATKDGKPVSSVVDMAVNFRIYSNRTAPPPPGATQQASDTPEGQDISPITGKPSLPGLFSTGQPAQPAAAQQPDAQQQPQSAPQQPR
jgi:hypothetical protein